MFDTQESTIHNRRARVWHNDSLVGHLTDNGENPICLTFTYDRDWLDSGGIPVSLSLPKSYNRYEGNADNWFTGLLPEGDSKEHLRAYARLRFTEYNDMKILLVFGGDCAGAFSVLPDGITPAQAQVPHRPLSDTELANLVHSKGRDLPPLPDGTVRFALAGAQRKMAAAYDGNECSLSGYGRPSTHILKFETIKRVCFAEHLATRIAGAAGLPVIRTEFLEAERQGKTVPYLRIDRFDRARDASGTVLLRHQEDMLQAMGMYHTDKYQSQGGPSLRDIAELLREHAQSPEEDIAKLADWQMLNFLLGNWDGHAKNLALLYGPDGEAPSLAPFYDFVSVEFLNALGARWDKGMGFFVGERNGPDRIRRQDWERMAEDLGLQPSRLLGRLENFATRLPDITEQVVDDFAATRSDSDRQVCRQLPRMVQKRCRRLLGACLARRPRQEITAPPPAANR